MKIRIRKLKESLVSQMIAIVLFRKGGFFAAFILFFMIVAASSQRLYSQEENSEIKNGENYGHDKENINKLSWNGLPLISYNSDDGFGYGARVYATSYKKGYAPFKWQTWAQYYKTTKKRENHEVYFDLVEGPGIPFRIRLNAGYARYQSAQYYGYGNYQNIQRNQKIVNGEVAVVENIPDSPDVYQFSGKLGEEISLNSNGGINPGRRILRERQNKFFLYDRVEPFGLASLSNWISRSNFKWWTAFRSTRYSIDSYEKDRDDGEAEPNVKTKIDLDQPEGYEALEKARIINLFRAALIYDSRPREREKNPDRGVYSEIHMAVSGKSIGSHYTFHKTTMIHRQYISLFDDFFHSRKKELVFAYRLLGQKAVGDAPFFEFGRVYSSFEESEGLGGTYGLRGYPSNQFVDSVMAMANTELRYTFAHKNWLGGMDWILLGYYDTGRVAPTIREMNSKGMHIAWGGGIRIVWVKNTIISISSGVSKYESFTAFSFNHMF